MATIKVFLRTFQKLKNGEYPIVLRVIKDRKAKFIYTGYSCSNKMWDFNKNQPSKKHPHKFELDVFIENKILEARKEVLKLENEKKEFTSEELTKKIKSSTKKITVFKFFDILINDLKKIDKIGNARTYKSCRNSLSNFRNGRDLNFSDIDFSFLKKFENYFVEKKITGNSISMYMRSLRSVYNKAISEGFCKKDLYPFDEYKISKLNTETSKRALTREQMDRIINLKVVPNSKLFDAKNIFLYSFYNRGMNFKDITLLKWKDIENGRMVYNRAKTGKIFNIGLLEPAIKILNYYKKFTGHNKENYVFMILNNQKHITPQQMDNRIIKMNKKINKDLKEIVKLAKVDFHLTTYVARHSYATIMKRIGVSTDKISESLGHNNLKTTQTYLDRFENLALDKANEAIL